MNFQHIIWEIQTASCTWMKLQALTLGVEKQIMRSGRAALCWWKLPKYSLCQCNMKMSMH